MADLTWRVTGCLLVLFLFSGSAVAANDGNQAEDFNQPSIVSIAAQDPNGIFQITGEEELPQGKVLTPLELKMSKIVSANYVGAPIESVLNQLARQADVDVIISPEVEGNVTVSLTDVPLFEALTNILAAHGYGYIATENMVRVVPLDQISVESQKLVDAVFRIKYADVTEVAKALEKFLSANGEIAVNPGTSNVLIMDTEQKIAAVEKFIQEIDRVTPQVLIEARIYDIKTTDSLDLGVDWTAGTETTFNDEGEAIGGKTQPFIEGSVVSNLNKATGDNFLRVGFLGNDFDLDARLRAEQDDISATLLANPRVLVLDNETAIFKSVSEIPYQELQETSAGGSIGTIEFKEVGVTLLVTPHIVENDNMIRLRVQPEFSVATGSVSVGGFTVSQTISQPVVDTRTADTTLIIKSNETVVLGGLRKKEVNIQKNKVPLLADIPGLGLLFQFESEKTVNSELVLFVTPTIVQRPILSSAEIEQLAETQLVPVTEYKQGRVDRDRVVEENEID